ncbi:MAG: energy transducer TonB [Bacteroides sp.]|nr:energy transducer TonB [Bacteroides sp.]MBD5378034.1 energy transducer TonB [Bacteroides sp.]
MKLLFSLITLISSALLLPQALRAESAVYDCACVDESPSFPGGDRAMLSFINSTREYPDDALAEGAQGRVTCSFIVKTDGSLCSINVIRGVHTSLDREAVRIISNMPRWQAGRKGGAAVPVYYVLSIPFRIY